MALKLRILMKNLLLFVLVSYAYQTVKSQNLIDNGGFETIYPPDAQIGQGMLDRAVPWFDEAVDESIFGDYRESAMDLWQNNVIGNGTYDPTPFISNDNQFMWILNDIPYNKYGGLVMAREDCDYDYLNSHILQQDLNSELTGIYFLRVGYKIRFPRPVCFTNLSDPYAIRLSFRDSLLFGFRKNECV